MVLAEDDVMGEGSVESCVVSAPKLAFLFGDVNFVLAGAVVAAVGVGAAVSRAASLITRYAGGLGRSRN
jgi:hypothetical protein